MCTYLPFTVELKLPLHLLGRDTRDDRCPRIWRGAGHVPGLQISRDLVHMHSQAKGNPYDFCRRPG